MIYVTSSRATLTDRLLALVSELRAANARRALYSQTMRELSALTDRDLVDLGIARSNIAEVALRAAYGR